MAVRYSLACPHCRHLVGVGRHLDPDSGDPVQTGQTPKRGDVTVCSACASLLMFDNAHTLVPMPEHHYDTVLAEAGMPTVVRILEMVRAIQEGKIRQ